ncbi:MAG: hypothetical protein K2O18_06380 [Oscillospiraceae bacterium]|nr:hypothetical protein [Oscillospiraceae bacterium]
MLEILKDHVSEAAAPFIFLVLFLVIVGGALWVTPRLAHWLDSKENKGYFDGMLEEDPNPGKQKTDGKKTEEK